MLSFSRMIKGNFWFIFLTWYSYILCKKLGAHNTFNESKNKKTKSEILDACYILKDTVFISKIKKENVRVNLKEL